MSARLRFTQAERKPMLLPSRPLSCWALSLAIVLPLLNLACSQVTGQEIDEVTGPRDMLRVMLIDDSQLSAIRDDRPLGDEEQETLLQLLFRIPSFSQVDVDQWSKPIEDWQQLLDDPSNYRYGFFHLEGEVIKLRARDVIPEMVARVGFEQYYELEIQHGDDTAIALVRQVPLVWLRAIESGAPIRQHVRLQAMLLKRVRTDDKPTLVFLASRVGWHPTTVSAEFGIGNDQILLGHLGLDISRLAEVQHKKGIEATDRECFYQTLAAVRSAEPAQLTKLGRQQFDIARMIKSPQEVVGELYTLRGRARRAILVRVEDPDIQARFGIDHYYEVDVFVPLDVNVRFDDPDDPDGKLFTDFPFVVCVPELPADMPTGDDIHVPISFTGFFVKLWAYRTEFMTGSRRTDRPKLQLSPLLIGPTVITENREFQSAPYLGLFLATLFTIGLLAIWFILWRTSVQDHRFAKTTLFRKHQLQDEQLRSLRES